MFLAWEWIRPGRPSLLTIRPPRDMSNTPLPFRPDDLLAALRAARGACLPDAWLHGAQRREPRPRLRTLAALATIAAFAAALAACGSGGGDAPAAGADAGAGAGAGKTDGGVDTGAGAASGVDVTAVLQQLNAARAVARTCGSDNYAAAAPVRWSSLLESAAMGHSEWMQANDTLSHTGAGGSSVGTRVTATGYAWRTVGENIAAGYADVPAAVAAWLASPGHCANIMNPAFVDVALALKPGTSANRYGTWWTLVLAQPK